MKRKCYSFELFNMINLSSDFVQEIKKNKLAKIKMVKWVVIYG